MSKRADSLGFLDKQGFPPRLGKEGISVSIIHLTSAPPVTTEKADFLDFNIALRTHLAFRRTVLVENANMHHIGRRSDLTFKEPHVGVLFGLQNAPRELSKDHVRMLRAHDLDFMSLAYDGPTEYGTGFSKDGPLTRRGKEVIEWMAEVGMTLDISHLSNQTALDALRFVRDEKIPMIPCASHSGCRTVYGHPRNASDEVLELLAKLRGFIGVNALSFFNVKDAKDLKRCFWGTFARQIRHAMKLMGETRVGIGSDCVHQDMPVAAAEAHYLFMTRNLIKTGGRFAEFFPDRPEELITGGSNLFEFLYQELDTFTDGELDGILGNNYVKYLRRILPQ